MRLAFIENLKNKWVTSMIIYFLFAGFSIITLEFTISFIEVNDK